MLKMYFRSSFKFSVFENEHCIFILGNVCVVQYDKETAIDVVNFRQTFNERRRSGVGAIKSFDGN